MTKRINFSLSYKNFITYRAMLTCGKTCLGTSGSYCLVDYLSVTECISLICYVSVATYGTGVSGVTTVYAIRKGYYCLVGVTERINYNGLAADLFTTYGTVYHVVVATVVYTIGSNIVFNSNLTYTGVNSEVNSFSSLANELSIFVICNEEDVSAVSTSFGGKHIGEVSITVSGNTGVINGYAIAISVIKNVLSLLVNNLGNSDADSIACLVGLNLNVHVVDVGNYGKLTNNRHCKVALLANLKHVSDLNI